MEQVKTLIDRAAASLGSRYGLAKQLRVDQGQLSKIASGKEPMPPALAARLAALTGDNPKDAACMAVIEQQKDRAKRQELYALFQIAPPAATRETSAAGAAHAAANGDPLCIMSSLLRSLRRLFSIDRTAAFA